MAEPAWFASVPVQTFFGKKMVSVDNNAISDYLLRGLRDDEIVFVFTSPLLMLKLARQVIGEALMPVDFPPADRPRVWDFLTGLQDQRKLVLLGTANMQPGQLRHYRHLQHLLRVNIGEPDARVLADGIATGVPIFTRERRLREGLVKALRNAALQTNLRANGLATTYQGIIVGPVPVV
jgi:hypothetical protein